MQAKILGLIILVLLIVPNTIIIAEGNGVGYLAIKDYLGTIWTMQDIEKIINYRFTTQSGELKSLADYFWIVVDDNTTKKYNLRNFTASPLDGKTAVLALPAGDHYVDIYWFGFHQRQLVHIVENEHYVLNLETAPVVPFKTAGEPPESAEWDLAYSPDGLKIQRRDGNAYVLFKYNTSYIEVAWYDEDLGGWNYQTLDVYIDTNYQYKFHVKDPSNPEYYEEGTGNFLWLSWDLYKVKEEVKWNRTGEILHVAYVVSIAENEAMFKSINEFWDGVGKVVTGQLLSMGYIDSILGQFISLKGAVELIQSEYDNYMGQFHASKYQKTVLLVWDVFVTPTQIIVLAHAYDVKQDGTVVKKPITSPNGLIIDNRLVFMRQLAGGYVYQLVYSHESITLAGDYEYDMTIFPGDAFKVIDYGPNGKNDVVLVLPVRPGNIYVDDLSMYHYEFIFSYVYDLDWVMLMHFNNTSKADVFQNSLDVNGISYTRSGNDFYFDLNIVKPSDIENYIPINSSGYVRFYFVPKVFNIGGKTIPAGRYQYLIMVVPKLAPPQISLLKDGYYTVNKAYAVQIFTDLYKEDKDTYMLGYYLLGNDPPPSFVIRDIYYDIDKDVMHYIYTVIPASLYGQDIVIESSYYNSTIHYYAELENSASDTQTIQVEFWMTDYVGIHVYYQSNYGYSGTVYFKIRLKNGTTITLWQSNNKVDSFTFNLTQELESRNLKLDDIEYFYVYGFDWVWFKILANGGYLFVDYGDHSSIKQFISYNIKSYNHNLEIPDTLEQGLLTNVTFALFNYNKMAFLNLAPDVIQHLLAVPPVPGYGTPVIDWSNVQVLTVDLTRPYKLYWLNNKTDEWVEVWPDYDSSTTTYYIKRISDNTTIETLSNGAISDYFYKLTYLDNNESYTGYLKNDNGTLKLIAVSVKWSLTPEELEKILQEIQLKGIYDKWLEQWNKVAKQLGLITEQLSNIASGIAGAWDWLNRNWKWVLVGIAGLFLLMALITRNTSKVVIAGRFR